tara:strand:- start:1112 stop:1858 length:747 start_codon:yes stop_codon:yes gene_type:complete
MNFIKKIFDGNIDENVHFQFIRFGKGNYKGRFRLGLWKTKKIKVKTSFEFSNDLVLLCSEFGGGKVSGIVLTKKDISGIMSENDIEGNSEVKKNGLYYQNNIPEQELGKEQIIELEKESYSALLDIEGEGFKLKVKKKLPKPGKNEDKIDTRFCTLEADEKFYSKIKEDFFWDMPEAKKIDITHEVIIDEIVMPESKSEIFTGSSSEKPNQGEKDFAKIRELAKRKGKIIRKAEIDGKEIVSEKEFEA